MTDFGGSLSTVIYDADCAENLRLQESFDARPRPMVGTWIYMAASSPNGAVSVESQVPYIIEFCDVSEHYKELENVLNEEMADKGIMNFEATVVAQTRVFTKSGKIDFKEAFQPKLGKSYKKEVTLDAYIAKENQDKYFAL